MSHERPFIVHRFSAAIRWFFGVSLSLITLKVAADLLAFPELIRTAGVQAPIYLAIFIVAVLVYSTFAIFCGHAPALQCIALRQGTVWGGVCGVAWIVELSVANLGWMFPQHGWLIEQCYFGSVLLGFLLPSMAGLLAARQTRHIRTAIVAGLLCGMLASIVMFLAYSALSVLLLQVGQHDPQILQEFRRSGVTDLQTYIVGDYLAAMIAHLWIGVRSGLGCGALGSGLGIALVAGPVRRVA